MEKTEGQDAFGNLEDTTSRDCKAESQRRPCDYREIDGIKCISIKAEDGRQAKNDSSISDIPISDELLRMGIWEGKPTLGWSTNNAAGRRIVFAFEQIGLKHKFT